MFRYIFALLAVSAPTFLSLKRGDSDCPPYDYMHTNGGPIAPCVYTPKYVANITIGENSDTAFTIDGAHLESKGAMAYLKSKLELDTDQFMKCQMADCSDLGSI